MYNVIVTDEKQEQEQEEREEKMPVCRLVCAER